MFSGRAILNGTEGRQGNEAKFTSTQMKDSSKQINTYTVSTTKTSKFYSDVEIAGTLVFYNRSSANERIPAAPRVPPNTLVITNTCSMR